MRIVATCLFALLVSACATHAPDDYEVGGRRVIGQLEGSRLIEEDNNIKAAAHFRQADRAPQAIKIVAPQMPRLAIARGIRGDVTAELLVEPDGSVSQVRILQSPDELLSNAVIDAMKQWTFSPLIVGGEGQRFRVRQTYAFDIQP
jgi:TonB family protein